MTGDVTEAQIRAGLEAFPGVIMAQYVKDIYLAMKALDATPKDAVERARIDVELALANWQKYNGEPQDEIVYQAEKVASAAKALCAALTMEKTHDLSYPLSSQ